MDERNEMAHVVLDKIELKVVQESAD